MVAWEGFALKYNLVLLSGGSIEACHHQVQVGTQCFHDRNLASRSANNGCHALSGDIVNVQEGR